MLTELINFTKTLSDHFKTLGLSPKEGLHILLKLNEPGEILTSTDSIEYAYYSKKIAELNPLLRKCMQLQENSWCINTNKCFDSPMKAMHTCSPFCMAFKREHLVGGKKHEINIEKDKPQIQERFKDYFYKAKALTQNDNDLTRIYQSFSDFFTEGSWEFILNDIKNQRAAKYESLKQKEAELKEAQKETKDKNKKAAIKQQLNDLQQELIQFEPLTDSDYIIFYLDLPVSKYKYTHGKYLDDKLFNTSDFNTAPNDEGLIFGTNDFQNGFNSKMPFLLHQTATFDISGRISNLDARTLYEFSNILPRKTLPSPLPIFIYNDEFKDKVIALYKEKRLGFKDIVETLYQSHKDDFQNYYLLNWANTQNGIVFNDYDFVSKFQYLLDESHGWKVQNLFGIYQKSDTKKALLKYYSPIKTIFELEDRVLKYLIQNKYHRVDYFSDLKKEEYDNKDLTFLSFCKYRKSVYDYVYKSNRNTIGGKEFNEMIFNAIKDDFKNNDEYGIKEKLNYWYSLYEKFHNPNNKHTMANKLKECQDFVENLINDTITTEKATDTEFAFAAGQAIRYLISKSKSSDTSFKLMEPYLQKVTLEGLLDNIRNDFNRYKHENFSKKFQKVIAFVLNHESEGNFNLKKLYPKLLSGFFADNQLFSNTNLENQ